MSEEAGQQQKIIDLLERVLVRVEALEERVAALSEVANEAKNAVAIATDTADEAVAGLLSSGVDLQQRAKDSLALLETMTEEKTLHALQAMLQQVSDLQPALAMLHEIPNLVAMTGDIVDESVEKLAKQGIHVEVMARQLARSAAKLAVLTEPENFDAFLESGIMDPPVVRFVGHIGRALAKGHVEAAPPVGMFGLLQAIRDPDVQRFTGFLVRFAKCIGHSLGEQALLSKEAVSASHQLTKKNA